MAMAESDAAQQSGKKANRTATKKEAVFMKKILSIFLVMVGLLGILPASAQSLLATDNIDASLRVASFRYEKSVEKPDVEIRSVEEMNGYIGDYHYSLNPIFIDTIKYGESFFNDKFLYFYHITKPSQPNEFEVKSIVIREDVIQVDVLHAMMGENTAIEQWLLILEIDRTLLGKDVNVTITTGFGEVPKTGVQDITGYALAMLAFLVTSATLWGYILSSKVLSDQGKNRDKSALRFFRTVGNSVNRRTRYWKGFNPFATINN